MANADKPRDSSRKPTGREWTPHIWQGMAFFAWLRLLASNRFAVYPSCLYIAVIVSIVSVFHSLLRFLEEVIYGSRIRRTRLPDAPLFIIGHWRTGTTLLHELLILDDRHNFPTTYECLAPNHFLISEGVLTRLLWFFMPHHRPMDNMAAGWDRPQECEFALAMMGQPSPYLTIAFPNRPHQDYEALDLDKLSPRARASWKRSFLWFIRRLTLRNPKRLILKSPTHTCRIKELLELFPGARFVHIVRDPYVVFPSTVNLWKSLYRTHGLQIPTFAGLEEVVFRTFTHLYEKLEKTRSLVDSRHFYELRYEDLIRDPIAEMRALYKHLELSDFETLVPRIENYLAQVAGYQTNRYELFPERREEVKQRWGAVIRRYGYEPEPASPMVVTESAPMASIPRVTAAGVRTPLLDGRTAELQPQSSTL